MKKYLRILRISIATIVFITITCGFLNMSGGNPVSQMVLRTQFTPALVSIFTGSALAFALLVILTLLFGRVYCSFLCPLGIFQDLVTRISNIAKKKANGGKLPKQKYSKPHNVLRYTILVLTGISLVAGFTYPLALLDPYSNYGKIAGQVFGSIELAISNMLSGIFPSMFYVQDYVTVGLYAFIYSIFFMLVVIVFSAAKGRLYCNTICPVGSFLGLLSGFSLFKPVINKDMCVKCNQCATKCKSNCINLETKEIDTTRCVACYNCITACKRGGVSFVPTWFRKKENADPHNRTIENKERRNALIAMGGFAAAVAARSFIFPKASYAGGTPVSHDNTPIMPPGARNLTAFKDACTACHACVAACPNNIIKPASFEYGLDGIMLPTINYSKNSCKYSCNTCSQVCPHGALEHISLEEKQHTRIALATYDQTSCVVVTDGVKCGACSKRCPADAIQMKENPVVPGQFLPNIDTDKCIGCGACMDVCPAIPKAITIKGVTVQTKLV